MGLIICIEFLEIIVKNGSEIKLTLLQLLRNKFIIIIYMTKLINLIYNTFNNIFHIYYYIVIILLLFWKKFKKKKENKRIFTVTKC